jgi:hypothetical protein
LLKLEKMVWTAGNAFPALLAKLRIPEFAPKIILVFKSQSAVLTTPDAGAAGYTPGLLGQA